MPSASRLSAMIEIARSPNSWILPSGSQVVRIPTRPLAFRQPDFDERFDTDTLLYDAFWATAGKRAILLGPPHANLGPAVASMRVSAIPSGTRCDFWIAAFDRHAQIWIEPPAGTQSLHIAGELGDREIALHDNECARFAGKRVIFTLSKNNRPEWIADWIRYHRDAHGADAVLLYDNNSTDYDLEELQQRLAVLSGIDAMSIVPWPFKYGAQGFGGLHWDSDFCQIGALQDARWRFLQAAKSVINVDVDELTVSHRPAFELIESAKRGYLSFFGQWVVGTSDCDEQLNARERSADFVRHADFTHVQRVLRTWKRHPRWKLPVPGYLNRSAPKWGVVPARCPASAQWTAHGISGIAAVPAPIKQISYRHFREINTGWKYDRSKREAYNPKLHRYDTALVSSYRNIRWDD